MATLTYKQRKSMPTSSFALPSKRKGGKGGYPISDKARAKAALQAAGGARTGKPLPPAQRAQVRRKVHARFPSLGKLSEAGPKAKKA